jgi:glycosyltransferase involved in cell wall biosynthesis
MKIALIHPQDINDRNLWSGTVYYIYQSIKRQFNEVVVLSPIKEQFVLLKYFFRSIEYIRSKVIGKQQLNYYYTSILPKIQGRIIDKFVNENKIDCIISTTNSPFIYTKSKTPLILITDASVKLLFDEYSNGKSSSELFFNDLEKKALRVTQKSALIVVSSISTANSLKDDYKIMPSKIATIPFGANIENGDIQITQRTVDKSNPLNFLFVGKDWERKGGDFTVLVCDELIQQNIPVHLSIVGCKVPEKFHRTYLENYIYLDKNKKDDFNKLRILYREAHFFMGFSKAEMYGIVFCEAAAYGLPVITFEVGGISDIVLNGKTGIMLPKGTGEEIFVSKIKALISDPIRYQNMSVEARSRYETLLNWDTFTNTLKTKIDEILNSNLHPTISNDITT